MGRWEGGSGGRGHILMADSCCCMQKPAQHFKAINLQLKKKKTSKKEARRSEHFLSFSPHLFYLKFI